MLQGGESQRPWLMVRIKLRQYVASNQVQGTVISDSPCVDGREGHRWLKWAGDKRPSFPPLGINPLLHSERSKRTDMEGRCCQ